MLIQHFNRKAIKLLSVEEKARLMDFSSGVVIWRMAPLLVLILGFSAFTYGKHSLDFIKIGLFIYLGLIVASSVISNVVVQRKYREMGFPESYLRTTLYCSIATVLLLTGFIASIAFRFPKIHG
jgi:hypothetical protein